jgi:esterase/lipase superfamily enzyme
MPVIRLGEKGLPLVYIPSSGGDHLEFDDYGMPAICEPWIRKGLLQLFVVDGWGPQGLFNDDLAEPERVRRHAAYERYVTRELLPWVRKAAAAPRVGILGCSYGAFVAANQLLKAYDQVEIACGLGGVYGMWHRHPEHRDDETYFHTPLDYLPGLDDPVVLDALRRTRGMHLFAAAADPWLEHTHRMARLLESKNLPHRKEVWPQPADHHERWWRRQLRSFLQRVLGRP